MLIKATTVLLSVAMLALTACAAKKEPAGTTVTTMPATTVPTAGGQQVVIEPGGTGGASARGEVRHTLAGRVDSINRNDGEVTVKSTDGSKMTVKVPPLAAANIREGDDVTLNMVVRPR